MANFRVFKSTNNGNFVVASSLAPLDITPDSIGIFTNRTGVNLSTSYTTDSRVITGMSDSTSAAASFSVTNGNLLINSVNAGASGSFYNGDSIQLQTTSSDSYGTFTTVSLAVNGEFFSSWSVQTYAQPIDLSPGDNLSGSDLLYNLINSGVPVVWW